MNFFHVGYDAVGEDKYLYIIQILVYKIYLHSAYSFKISVRYDLKLIQHCCVIKGDNSLQFRRLKEIMCQSKAAEEALGSWISADLGGCHYPLPCGQGGEIRPDSAKKCIGFLS